MNKILKTTVISDGVTYTQNVEWGLGDDGKLYFRNKNGDHFGRMWWSEYDGLSIEEMKHLVHTFENLLAFL